MRKRRLINSLLACAIFIVQGTGMHLHAHQHARPHDSSEPHKVHLASATSHVGDQANQHDQDVDVDPGIAIVKKAGIDEDVPGVMPLNSIPQILLTGANQPQLTKSPTVRLSSRSYVFPPLRAPPAINFNLS